MQEEKIKPIGETENSWTTAILSAPRVFKNYWWTQNDVNKNTSGGFRGWLHGEFQPGQPGWKKVPITWNISALKQKKLKSEMNPVCQSSFQPGMKFFHATTWDFSARLAQTGLKLSARGEIQLGLKLFSCNRELCFPLAHRAKRGARVLILTCVESFYTCGDY